MSGSRKFYRAGDVVFLTTSVEKGLMLPPNALIETIILSCLARAQERYYVEVCHLITEATHVHILAVVHNPLDVPNFMRYFKTESSHALNKLMGWNKNTIWCEGYDSPVLLLPEDVRKKITYIYSQPSKDDLGENIDTYAALNTWRAFTKNGVTGKSNKKYHYDAVYLARGDYPYIGRLKNLKQSTYRALAKRLKRDKKEVCLVINPDGWRKAFPYLNDEDVDSINQKAISILRQEEEESRQRRRKQNKGIIPRKIQVETPIGTHYQPKRSGRRMRCHCSDPEVRKIFLEYTSWLVEKAKDVYERWKQGDYSTPYPIGLFPPTMPRIVEPIVSVITAAKSLA